MNGFVFCYIGVLEYFHLLHGTHSWVGHMVFCSLVLIFSHQILVFVCPLLPWDLEGIGFSVSHSHNKIASYITVYMQTMYVSTHLVTYASCMESYKRHSLTICMWGNILSISYLVQGFTPMRVLKKGNLTFYPSNTHVFLALLLNKCQLPLIRTDGPKAKKNKRIVLKNSWRIPRA